MATKRFRNGAWHYRISKKGLLANPIYVSFADEKEGDAHVASMEAMLARGIVPSQARSEARKTVRYQYLKQIIAAEIAENRVSPTDAKILLVVAGRIGDVKIDAMNYHWVESWIKQMKRVDYLSPTTIRHHVGALARCLDQVAKRGEMRANPIRLLPRRYSVYSEADKEALPAGRAARVDDKRDRRLDSEEEKAIRKILGGEKVPGKQRALTLAHRAALEFLFDLALESAMRMQEMYTLDLSQINLEQRTIFLDKTKNGDKRQVPMTTVCVALFKAYVKTLADSPTNRGLLFPWWDGEQSKDSLNRTTSKLSAQFSRIFDAAGCPDLRFHDLRHEATSRFFERTALSDTEIAKVTGHKSPSMLARYANLRGSVLASRLW